MSKGETGIADLALHRRVHKVYGDWAPHHADGEAVTVRDYDESEYYQRSDLAFFNAEPDLEVAIALGRAGMGDVGYDKLAAGYDEHNVLDLVLHRHEQGKSTLIPTLHFKDVLDTAMTHNRLFVSSEGDPAIAEINDIVANPMMGRLTIGGLSAIKAVLVSGNVDLALPSDAARRYGMSKEDITYLERFYARAFGARLGNNRKPGAAVAVNWALTGTRGKRIRLKNGDEASSVVRVADGIADIAYKRTGVAIPVPMDVRIGNCQLEVLKPRPLDSVEDVHRMMEEMVEVATDLAGEKIYYGLPEGATYIEN